MRKLLAALTATLAWTLTGCGYNTFQTTDEQVKASWSEVINQYQRRADLVPNLVPAFKGEAKFEQDTLTKVIEARSKGTSTQAAPELVNDPADFQEGTENRITVARNRYIKSVQDYNVTVRSFPSSLTAMVMSYKEKANFAVENENEISKPPSVEAIKVSETKHAGEIRFVVEGALDGMPLFKGQSPRDRAIELFAQLRVWDTEHNSGLLIYLLPADRAVEIVADRGIHAKVGAEAWRAIRHHMEAAFKQSNYEGGVISGVQAVTQHLVRQFPAGDRGNELPDRPVDI